MRLLPRFGVLLSLALVLGYFENVFIGVGLFPGVKLGLANSVTLLTILIIGPRYGLYISGLRSVLTALVTGSFLSLGFFLSLAGGLLSAVVMGWLWNLPRRTFSILGVSALGAFVHSAAQVAVYCFATATWGMVFYLPYLVLLSIFSGLATGLVVRSVYTVMYRVS